MGHVTMRCWCFCALCSSARWLCYSVGSSSPIATSALARKTLCRSHVSPFHLLNTIFLIFRMNLRKDIFSCCWWNAKENQETCEPVKFRRSNENGCPRWMVYKYVHGEKSYYTSSVQSCFHLSTKKVGNERESNGALHSIFNRTEEGAYTAFL